MTTNEAVAREEEIVRKALAMASPDERRGFIKGVCAGDAGLLARVEAMMDARQNRSSSPPANHTIRIGESAVTEGPGTIIGRYKILQQIGEGGCGVVYMAEQEQPVRRRVALKVIKLGMDTRAVIARFEAERQALALMDHPNIAKVLDAGATDTGRPYFVMELVRGVRITEYCDQARCSARERLDLFVQVCHAIQHAHQKGIIHRDLKPSNILITINDGVAVPKVIDFGIAKATTDQRLTEKTLFTAFEQFIGTPAYMSPEQAVMTSLDIDTRSDIYSLGVLLYELLAGRTPFDPKELVNSGFDEMRRTIRDKEPERPSTCLSTMPEQARTDVANRRQANLPDLVHLLRGDLDWIVMKAMEKDRTRRYETANGLAMDIQRYQNNEPVLARPPSSVYRFKKLARRNRTLFMAATAVGAALVFGFGVSTYLFVRERQARERAVAAEREEARLREKAEWGKKYAEAGLMMSQGQYERAEELVNQVPIHPSAAAIYFGLGVANGARGHWQRALVQLSRVAELVPTNHLAQHYLTPLYLQLDDPASYRRHVENIIRLFSDTHDPVVAERIAKDCLILPPAASQWQGINQMVNTAYAAGPDQKTWRYTQFVKGLADYRQGQYSNAVVNLSVVAQERGDSNRALQSQAVLAMARYRLGHKEARSILEEAKRAVETRAAKGRTEEQWHDWIFAQTLVREAETTIR